MGSLEVVGGATEEWNLLVVELGVISEKKKGIDLKTERQPSILSFIIFCLTRTGNYKIHEFDWLKSILTAV